MQIMEQVGSGDWTEWSSKGTQLIVLELVNSKKISSVSGDPRNAVRLRVF